MNVNENEDPKTAKAWEFLGEAEEAGGLLTAIEYHHNVARTQKRVSLPEYMAWLQLEVLERQNNPKQEAMSFEARAAQASYLNLMRGVLLELYMLGFQPDLGILAPVVVPMSEDQTGTLLS